MSINVEYRKEFEDIILKGNLEESLKTLVPQSKEEMYIKFCEEFKKCVKEEKITSELNSLLEKSKKIPAFGPHLETRKLLLEYDLKSTSQERKNQILEELYRKFCGMGLNFQAPFFAREKPNQKKDETDKKTETNSTLTQKMIDDAIKDDLNKNKSNVSYKLISIPLKDRKKYILEILKNKDYKLAYDLLKSRQKIPFYLMTKDEFSKVINFMNKAEKELNNNNLQYENFTVEQLKRVLSEVKNELHVNKNDIVFALMNKKYNKLIHGASRINDFAEIKNILLEIKETFKDYYQDFISYILIFIIKINKLLGIYDKEPLLEYLKNPLTKYVRSPDKVFKNEIRNEYYYSPLFIEQINFDEIANQSYLEKVIIDYLVLEKLTIKDLEPYFLQKYYEKLDFISKIYKGEDIKFDEKYISKEEYDKIIKSTEITICEHNKKEFKIDEDINIDFDFKNVKSINVSVYEINTENYYLAKESPITSLINVEGIIATETFDLKIEGGESQTKKIRKNVEFKKIEKKPGVFLIEILGNGISSRLIIKKGRLNLITRNTSKGLLCQIINEKNEILKDEKTYLWYNNLKFECEPKEGLIILPYKVFSLNKNKCIICHNNYADLGKIPIKSENYDLKGYFNFNTEGIIPGNNLKVTFKPLLYCNGREVSLEILKNGIITVDMQKSENFENLPVSTIFENVEFKDDNKEYEFEVLIPPMMQNIKFNFKCTVKNSMLGEQNLSFSQNDRFCSSNNIISKYFLHKVGKNYIYEYLGRNGENITSQAGSLFYANLYVNNYNQQLQIKLQFDKDAKVNLGELKNVYRICLHGFWYKINENSKYTYPKRVDIVKGENFTLPLYTPTNINNEYFVLTKYYTRNQIAENLDVSKEIILTKLEINENKENYYEFTLGNSLTKGKYKLTFGEKDSEINIKINVTEGKHWMNIENYIINDYAFIENSQIKTPLYMKNLKISKENGEIKFECAKTKRKIKNIHCNIILYQYHHINTHAYFDKYNNMLDNNVEKLLTQKFQNWKNIYLSNRILNEEIQYVLQRRNLENQLGNSLQMPSLLLKRSFKKDCKNEEEKLEKGNEYKKEDASIASAPKAGVGSGYRNVNEETYSDIYNFLQNSCYVLNNILPVNSETNDDFAKFEIKLENNLLSKYSYLQIVLVDNKSIMSDLQFLSDENYNIEKRNIANEKSLDNSKNLSEVKKTELIKKGEEFKINETSNFKIVDSIQKLSKFYLLTLNKKFDYWEKYKFILELDENKFNEEKFLEKYNEVCGHEINLFLYFKYPKIFEKYVKNLLKYKFEKTFIDYFLLNDTETLLQYLTPLKISKLNTDELCLLMLKIVDSNKESAEKIKNIIKSRIKKPKDIENILLSNFSIMMNMRIDEDKDLEKIKEIHEEEAEIPRTNQITTDALPPQRVFRMAPMGGGFGATRAVNRAMPRHAPPMAAPMMASAFSNVMQTDSLKRAAPRDHGPMMDEEPMLMCNMVQVNRIGGASLASNAMNNLCQADFLMQEKGSVFSEAVDKGVKQMGAEFEKPGKAKEFKERHYYLKKHKCNIDNPFWLDFAEYILDKKSNEGFLSKYVLYNNDMSFKEFLMIISVIDIPVENKKHNYKKIPNSRLVSIIPENNLILFTKELTETKLELNTKLIISQNFIDSVHNEQNANTNNCTTNITYTHQTIVTNISNQKKEFELFVQIPQGAIPLNSSYYTNTKKINLEPYETKDHKTQFYFPKEGKFGQYHPIACKNGIIISVGNVLEYLVKSEYTPSKKIENLQENNKYAKDLHIDGKLRNILSDDSVENDKKLENILEYFKNDVINDEDITNILYLLVKDKDFYNKFIEILKKRGYYDRRVWSIGFDYKDENAVKEFLSINNEIKNQVGIHFKSKLFSTSEIDEFENQHLEYMPLYNARKHPFGDKKQANIANKEFKETYQKFIINLLPLEKIETKEKLQLVYYLILQDRMDDALNVFQKINKEEIENNSKSFKIQYDYIFAYLDFCFGYPEFTNAKSLCNKYKDFPLEHWREKFYEIENQLFEYEGKEKVSMDSVLNDNNIVEKRKKLTKELREKEPKMSFKIKEGKITIIHSNISNIDIKFYFIDLETMFTRDPKISEIINKNNNDNSSDINKNDYFGYVLPNYSENLKIPDDKNNSNDNFTIYEIPKEYKQKNLFIELKSDSIKLFDIYLNSDLIVVITESLGELKVIDGNAKNVIKAYVKIYVELNNGEIQFYKDGYTDLNGKFNYLALNTDQLKNAKKFYVFVSEEKKGAVINECYPPKNIQGASDDNVLGNIERFKQEQRNKWRLMNKI